MGITNSMTPWIAVFGTLLGASIGFAASFLSTFFNKSREEKSSKEARDRERVERIYQLLVVINGKQSTRMSEMISWVHDGKTSSNEKIEDMPPLIELEMLIKLYFPSIEAQRKQLMKEIHAFTKVHFNFRFNNYKNVSLENKQKVSGVLVTLNGKIDHEIKSMQNTLVSLIKA